MLASRVVKLKSKVESKGISCKIGGEGNRRESRRRREDRRDDRRRPDENRVSKPSGCQSHQRRRRLQHTPPLPSTAMVSTVTTANAYSLLADDSPEPDPNLLDMEEMEA